MRNSLRWVSLLLLFWGTLARTGQAQNTTTPPRRWTAVITAHPDDWQLFMAGNLCEEVQRTRRRMIFICLTGGQANEPSDAYWQSREAGHRASVLQAVDQVPGTTPGAPKPLETVVINGHAIDMYRYKNTVACFLHLPDGGLDGRGLARGNFQSLRLLREKGTPIAPLNGGKAYTSWNELSQTIRELLAQQAVEGKLSIHCPQSDEQLNPGDHADHRMAGLLAKSAAAQLECCFVQYVGYNSARRPENLTPEQKERQLQVYRAYSQTMSSQGQYNAWDQKHLVFIGHQYAQVQHQTGAMLQPSRPVLALPAPDPTPDPTPSPASAPGPEPEGDLPDDEAQALAAGLVLEPNYPNPFAQSSLLAYQLPIAANVWLRILDMQGREVVRLLDGSRQERGRHEQWLDVSRFPAAGIYVAELRVGDQRRRCRLQLTR